MHETSWLDFKPHTTLYEHPIHSFSTFYLASIFFVNFLLKRIQKKEITGWDKEYDTKQVVYSFKRICGLVIQFVKRVFDVHTDCNSEHNEKKNDWQRYCCNCRKFMNAFECFTKLIFCDLRIQQKKTFPILDVWYFRPQWIHWLVSLLISAFMCGNAEA